MVKKCIGCGKYRSKWAESRKRDPRSNYCSDKCKVAHKTKPIFDGRTDPAVWQAVMKRDDYTCRYCGDKAEQVDHIIPYSRSGKSDTDNLAASCKWCNTKARDRLFGSFDEKRNWLRAAQKLPPIIERQINKRRKLDWHSWVYGGMKSLKRL